MSVNKLDEITELTRLGSRAAAAMIAGAPRFYALFAHNSALVSSGEKAPLLNKLAVGPGEDPTGFLRECAKIAWERKHPLTALFTPHVSASLAPKAVDLGFTPLGDTPLMVLQPKTALTVSGDCTIQRAIGLPALETAVTMLTRSLAPSANLPVGSFMRTLDVASTTEEVSVFTGSIDGLPMSTVTAVRAGETVGLSRMATPREFQRKGAGRALLAQVINLYLELGASRFYLSATEMGRPLYESLGFKTIGYCAGWQL
jgi:GNAT superfamily N-acetyltransferase